MVSSDEELLAAWAKGDRDAANQLFERHFTAVYRFFRSKLSEQVEDLVQDTFVGVVTGRERLRDTASFRSYMFGVARNILRQHFRKGRVQGGEVEMSVQSVVDLCPGFGTALGKKQEHRVHAQALSRLPVDYQIAIELFYWEKLSGPEIADVLELTEPAVRSRIHRAKKALRTEIEQVAGSAALIASTWEGLDQWAEALAVERSPPSETP
ncbi:MAG: sigma-70 family RNA polymerase sigma factor [Nannocystaceae bacterium]|nr:sigma-70 family RNA polymerase sigma factor [Nannocystaceae bacterium]